MSSRSLPARLAAGASPLVVLLLAPAACTGAATVSQSVEAPRVIGLKERDATRRAFWRETLAWRMAAWRNDDGSIAPDAMARAMAEFDRRRDAGVLGGPGGFTQDNWRQGPANLAGRTRALDIDPRNANVMIAGSVAGGLWRTTDGGASWMPVSDGVGSLAISSIVRSNENPDVLVASTGEPYLIGAFPGWGGFTGWPFGAGAEALAGTGMLRSTDNGVTWTLVANSPPTAFRLAISSNDVIVGGTFTGVVRSTDLGLTWTGTALPPNVVTVPPTGGNVRSAGACVVQDIDFSDSNPNDAAATFYWRRDYFVCVQGGGNQWVPAWNFGVMTSTNAGASWQITTLTSPTADPVTRVRPLTAFTNCLGTPFPAAQTPLPRVEIEFHGANLYALNEFGGVFRATFGSPLSFTTVGGANIGPQGWYDLALWVDPSDTDANPANDIVLVGGVTASRSTNGGTTFTQISDDMVPGSAHDDHHLFVEHPGLRTFQNRTVFTATDGGIFRAGDIDMIAINGWTSRNTGMSTTQFYGASRNADSMVTVGGTQDQGGLRTADFAPFAEFTVGGVTLGDSGMSASDPLDPNNHFLTGFFGRVLRSTDGGFTGTEIRAAGGGNLVAPLALHPNGGSPFLLIGDDSLWQCTNPLAATPTWTALPLPALANNPIAAIAVAPDNPADIWVVRNQRGAFTNQSRVFRSIDGGNTWVEEAFQRPNRLPTRIVIDPANNERVFLTFGGPTADNLWMRNGANNWSPITTPMVPARDFELHPTDPNVFLLATQLGLFASADAGQTWSVISPVPVSVDETFWSRGHLYLATHGRGLLSQSPFAAAATLSVGVSCQLGGSTTPGPLLTTDLPILGTTVQLDLTQATPNTAAAIVLGNPPAVPAPPCGAQAENAVTLGFFVTSGSGTGSATTTLPPDPVFAGTQLVAQGVEFPGSNILVSHGVRWTVGF